MKRWWLLALALLIVACASKVQAQTKVVYLPLVMDTEAHPVLGIGQHRAYANCANLNKLDARWAYNWSLVPQDCEGIEGVPMLWGASSAGKAVSGNHLLWFNEPDIAGQSNLTPQQAAALWNQYRPQYNAQRNGSPAVYSLWWLREWLPLVTIKPDFIAIHPYQFYGTYEQAQSGFTAYLNEADDFGYPIWITEYAWVTDSYRQSEWLTWSLTEIARHPRIERASWFIDWCTGDEPWAFPSSTNLLTSSGTLTSLGAAWTKRADVNGDNRVDIFDIVIVAGNFHD